MIGTPSTESVPRSGIEQPEHDVDGRGLASPGAADDADGAPRRDREAHALDRRPLGLRIGVVHVLELEPLGQVQRRSAPSPGAGRVGVPAAMPTKSLCSLSRVPAAKRIWPSEP